MRWLQQVATSPLWNWNQLSWLSWSRPDWFTYRLVLRRVYVRVPPPCGGKHSCGLRRQLSPRVRHRRAYCWRDSSGFHGRWFSWFWVSSRSKLDESSIIDPPALVEEHDAPTAVTFKLIPDATSKDRPKLVNSRGYSYNIRQRWPNAVDWQCTIRQKVNIVSR